HGDIGRLRLDQVVDAAGVGVKAVRRVVVADVVDGAAGDARHVDVGRGGDLTGDDAGAGGDEDFAGHAARGVFGEHGVEDGVGNLVGDLIGMAFGHRFRREDVLLCI